MHRVPRGHRRTPVEEENDLPFKSEVPGVMHACGHDIHTAVLLTFAKVLTAHPELVRGTVKLIFQAAEEKLREALRRSARKVP